MVLLYVINDVRQYLRMFPRSKVDRSFVGILVFQEAALASLCWRSWPLNASRSRHLRFTALGSKGYPRRRICFAEDNGAMAKYARVTNRSMTEVDKDEQFYRDTESIAFPKLDDRQLAMLEPLGVRRLVRRGELVYKAGQHDLGLTAVLRGELEVFESRDGQEQILATAGPRGFIVTLRCSWAPRRWPIREAKRMRAKFWKCRQIGFVRRSQNFLASVSRSCALSSCVASG